MNFSNEIDLFKISRILLQLMGETYNKNTLKRIIFFRIFNSIIMVYTSIIITANFFYASGGNHVETMQGLILVMHTLLKYLSYIYFKPGIRELLQNKHEESWVYQHIDNHIIAAIIKMSKSTELIQVSVLLAMSITAILYLFRPILTRNNPFPFEAWVSGVVIMDVITLACLYYFFCIVIPIVLSYDSIYLCLCIQTVGQVKLLKNRLRYFQGSVKADVSYYIKYHQFLLSTFAGLRRLYSSMLLFHYFVTLITACTGIFEVLMGRNSATDIAAKAITICAAFFQFAYYTFPAEMIAFELSDLSNSIYLSKWYINTVNVQKQLLFMMTKSQHQLYFTGGGLIDINVKTFGSAVRTSFSFYTLLRNILTK